MFKQLRKLGLTEKNPGSNSIRTRASQILVGRKLGAITNWATKHVQPISWTKVWSNLGKISAQPHTTVKQIFFPNGNVLFLSLFSLFKNWMHNEVWVCAETLL